MKHWLLAVSMAANQLVNALTGGNPQMSVSARAGYAREHGSKGGIVTCRVLEFLDVHPFSHTKEDHCQIAIRNYETRIREAELAKLSGHRK